MWEAWGGSKSGDDEAAKGDDEITAEQPRSGLFKKNAVPSTTAEPNTKTPADKARGVLESWTSRISAFFARSKKDAELEQLRPELDPRTMKKAIGDLRDMFYRVKLPQDWNNILDGDALSQVYKGPRSRVYTAGCSFDEQCMVAIKVTSSKDLETRNEIRMMKMLRGSGNVVSCFASEEYPSTSYMLMPATEKSLQDVIADKFRKGNAQMPLNESLPILIDLLRGIRDLNERHIVHCQLTEENVLMKDGRPLISDFGVATVVKDSETSVGHNTVGPYELPFVPGIPMSRLPPETIRGAPTGPSNNVYQVGAIFSLMTLGYVPMLRGLQFTEPVMEEVNIWDPQVDEKAQNLIRTNFSIAEDKGVQAIRDEDVRDLLLGMLENDLSKRWDTIGALKEAMAIAWRRGIEVPPEREPFRLPVELQSDWE